MKFHPGSVASTAFAGSGLPSVAGKTCASDSMKTMMDAQTALKLQTLPVPGQNGTTVTVYCADSRLL